MNLDNTFDYYTQKIPVNYHWFSRVVNKSDILQKELIKYTCHLDIFKNVTLHQRIWQYIEQKKGTIEPGNFFKCKYCNSDILWKKYVLYCDDKECIKKKNLEHNKSMCDSVNAKNMGEAMKIFASRKGLKNFMQSDEVKKKRKAHFLEHYGVESPLQIPEVKDKKEKTCIAKYGYKHPFQCETVQQKRRNTIFERNGVTNCMQLSKTLDKNILARFKWKDFIFPSGKKVKVQGYENLVIEILLKKYEEHDIIIGSREIEFYIGRIFYTDKNNKLHRYFPDIFIKSENLVIEVKSVYTFLFNSEIIFLKEIAVIESGFNYKFMVLDHEFNCMCGSGNEILKILSNGN